MTNGLVQHITVEESSSIQWVKVSENTSMYVIFIKGNNWCDFLFASLKDVALLESGLFLQFVPKERRDTKEKMVELLS